MSNRTELSEALMEWAVGEMKFHGCNGNFVQPTLLDFQRLCKPPLSDVWPYVLKHVKSVQTVKKVKGNLAIQKHLNLKKALDSSDVSADDSDSELGQLVREKKRLLEELSNCEREVNMLEGEMEHTKLDLLTTELEYQTGIQKIRDLQKKDSLLNVVQACGAESVDRYGEYARRVSQRAVEVIARRTNTGETAYSKGKSEEIETQCCRDVRLSCESCADFLRQAVDGKFPDKQTLEAAKSELSKQVSSVSSSHTAGGIVSALTVNTGLAARDTREQTVGINIAQDVTDLSFSLKSNRLEDLSNPPTVTESVRQLLQESNVEHIMRWFKEQELKNESWKLEARLDSLLAEINKLIHQGFGDNTETLALAKRYVNSLITLAIEKSVSPCLKEVINNLEERKLRATQEREELQGKFERIQNFRTLVDKKQSIIEVLAKQNSGAPDRLSDQRKQVLKFISDKSVPSSQSEVSSLSASLREGLTQEVDKFSHTKLSALHTLELDSTSRQCVLDLSLSPSILPAVCRKANLYRDIREALAFPSYKNVDCLLDHVVDMQHDIHSLQFKEQKRKWFIHTAKHSAQTDDDVNAIVALCDEVRRHEDKQMSSLLPQLQRCITIATKHNKERDNIKKQLIMWWDQPAQHLTPWISTEGLTFDLWMRKWRSVVAQVNKKMINMPQKK